MVMVQQNSIDLLAGVLQAATEYAIIATDPQGLIIVFNEGAERMLGYRADEVIGKATPLLFHDPAEVEERARQLGIEPGFEVFVARRNTDLAETREWTYLRKDGKAVPVSLTVTTMRDGNRMTGFIGIARDITSQREALEEQQRLLRESEAAMTLFRNLLESAPDGIVVVDMHGSIVLVNSQTESLFGYSREELIGQSVEKLVPERFREHHRLQRENYQQKPKSRSIDLGLDLQARRKDGSDFPVEISLSPTRVSDKNLVIAVIRDISMRRQRQRELELLQTITQAIVEAEDLQTALEVALEKVCRATGWSYGESWLPDAAGAFLERGPDWSVPDERLLAFRHASKGLRVPNGLGLPGRVWATGRPEWIADTATEASALFLRSKLAAESGLKTALGVPILDGDVVIAILVFYLWEPRAEDKRLVEIVTAAATQLGAVLQRKRIESERNRLLEQERAARSHAERLAAERAAILRQIADGVVITDARDRILFANEAACRFLGTIEIGEPIEEQASQYPIDLLDGQAYVAEEFPLTRAAVAGETVLNAELRARPSSGEAIVLEGSAAPVVGDDGSKLGAVLTLHDVTAQRELERQKDEFITNVSHDLRTPVTAIKASIGVVLANEPPNTPEPMHRMFVNIDLAADRMVRLVGDLLDLARLRAGRLQLHRRVIDLRELAERSIAAIDSMAQARSQRIEVDLPSSPVLGFVDGERLERAMVNVLANASKYGINGGFVRLSLEPRDTEVEFTVSDNGPGIPEFEQDRIFDRFFRSETEATQRNQGSGLGLPIARAMVELHGGRIWVESAPGAGATFKFVIPYALAFDEVAEDDSS